MKKTLYIWFLFMLSSTLWAQAEFSASVSKNKVYKGEVLELRIKLITKDGGSVEDIHYPGFNGFRVVGRKEERRLNITNGEKTSENNVYILLRPEREGALTIPESSVKVNGIDYKTKPVIITVLKRAKTEKKNNTENRQVFLNLELEQSTAYPNEAVLATVKLYAKSFDLLRKRTEIQAPSLANFQVKKISGDKGKRNLKQENLNGKVYVSEEVAKFVLLPQKTGNLEIPSFQIKIAVPLDFLEDRIVNLNTQPQKIKVKKLPAKAPKNFNGAVGDFEFDVEVDKKQLEKDEAFNIKVKLKGEGNLSAINLPQINLDEDLETYKQKQKKHISEQNFTEKGDITDNYVVVPQFGGEYKIPVMEFSYFDPKKGKYITLKTKEINLSIKGEIKPPKDSTKSLLPREEDIDTVSLSQGGTTDSHPILTAENDFLKEVKSFNKKWLYILLLIPIALFLWFRKKKKNEKELPEGESKPAKKEKRIKKAELVESLNQLKEAQQKDSAPDFEKKAETFLQKVVKHYSKQDQIFTQQEAVKILQEKVSPDFAKDWEKTYTYVQTLRYSGGESQEDLQKLYELCRGLLK